MTARIALIAAVGPNRIIGTDNKLPWRLPKDLKFFRRVTTNHAVVMGRRTFESLGGKPLPKRINIVLSRTSVFDGHENLFTASSLENAIELASELTKKKRFFVIGGQSVYEQALPLATELFLSSIEDRSKTRSIFGELVEGDAYFPPFDINRWVICHLGRYFRARNTLQSTRRRMSSELYFRMWKLVRAEVGCTAAEERRLLQKKDFRKQLIAFWRPGGSTEHVERIGAR